MRIRKIAAAGICIILGLMSGCAAAESTKSSTAQTPSSVITGATVPEESSSAPKASSSSQAFSTISAPSGSERAETGIPGLKVVGNKLCDQKGNPIQLRGVSTHGLAWFPQYINEKCITDLKDWGANVLRLALYTAEYDGYCTGGDKEKLKNLIHEGVKYATYNGMYVIIDWHVLSEGDPNVYKEEAKNFFNEMSRIYADQPNVIYEICNEPCNGATWDRVAAYANEVIPVIRANSPDSVILVGTPNWSQDVDKAAEKPLSFENVMYTLHFYAATHKDDLMKKMQTAGDAGLPIFVSEFGICDASGNGAIDEDSANKWVEAMNRANISYVCWNLSNKAESSALISSSCQKTSGFTYDDLSLEGKWLRNLIIK